MGEFDRWTRNAAVYWSALAVGLGALVIARTILRGPGSRINERPRLRNCRAFLWGTGRSSQDRALDYLRDDSGSCWRSSLYEHASSYSRRVVFVELDRGGHLHCRARRHRHARGANHRYDHLFCAARSVRRLRSLVLHRHRDSSHSYDGCGARRGLESRAGELAVRPIQCQAANAVCGESAFFALRREC
jgi:hypothetical protein